MNVSSLKRMVFAAAMVLTAGMAHAVTYLAVDLNPSGFTRSTAFAISGTQQVGSGRDAGNQWHALLWSGTAQSVVDLNPSGFNYSEALGVSGTQQVGDGLSPSYGDTRHALLWSGTAASAVDLTPSGFNASSAVAISGTQQVGDGYGPATGSYDHALLWSGTAASAVDLNPSGFTLHCDWTLALGTNGTQQVGYGQVTDGYVNALLWSGTAASAVDLNPSGFTSLTAKAISGTQQVGSAGNHAFLWSGTAASAVDLNPSGFTSSSADGTNGTQQVGCGTAPGGQQDPLVWSGTAQSAVDLSQFLPSGLTSSNAVGIDAQGDIVGSANDASGHTHAIIWEPVPEWRGPGGGIFSLAANWTNNSVPNGVDAAAGFSGNITAPSTVTLDSPVTLGALIFNSLQSYTLAGASTLTLQTSSGNASINVITGSHQISVPVIINSDTVISGAGTLDLSGGISGAHTLTVQSTLTATSIQVDTLIIGGAGAAAVPEPSTLVLLALGAIGLLAWPWRRRTT